MSKGKNEFPAGWDEKRVLEVLDDYDNQTDEEAAAEHEAALARPDHTLMPIPHALVPEVQRLLAEHGGKRPAEPPQLLSRRRKEARAKVVPAEVGPIRPVGDSRSFA